MFRFAMVLASMIIVLSALYLGVELIAGWREAKRQGAKIGDQALLKYGHPHVPPPPAGWFVYFLVPALNEAAVIATTVAGLVGPDTQSRVVVIDDGSDDQTSAIAREAGGPGITVLRRNLPDARQGKGAALNFGYKWVASDARDRKLDLKRVVVCVMDADGRLSDGALQAVLPQFDDPAVGAVQLAVRIRNRDRFLTQYQDYLFWSLAAVTQLGRIATGSVSLGGNGQFTRLTALESLGNQPWSDSLTEDLDLGLRLALKGWVATSTPGAAVDQQAIGSFNRLIRQRTRWYQGHMTSGAYIKEIWNSRELPHLRALELIAYLLCPWVLDLPWSILFHLCLIGMVDRQAGTFLPESGVIGIPVALFVWYLLAFFPALITGSLYYRRDREVGFIRAMVFSHAVVLMNYVSFICVWWALSRIVTGRKAWAKTQRDVETTVPAIAALGGAIPARAGAGPAVALASTGGDGPVRPLPPGSRPATTAGGGLREPLWQSTAPPAVRVAATVAWEKLAELMHRESRANSSLAVAMAVLVDASADEQLAKLCSPFPRRPVLRYEVETLEAGSVMPGQTATFTRPTLALRALAEVPTGSFAILTSRSESASRLVASVDGEGLTTFIPPDSIALEGPGSDQAVMAWARALGLPALPWDYQPGDALDLPRGDVPVPPRSPSPARPAVTATNCSAAHRKANNGDHAVGVTAGAFDPRARGALDAQFAAVSAEVRELRARLARAEATNEERSQPRAERPATSGATAARYGRLPELGKWLLPIDVDFPVSPAGMVLPVLDGADAPG